MKSISQLTITTTRNTLSLGRGGAVVNATVTARSGGVLDLRVLDGKRWFEVSGEAYSKPIHLLGVFIRFVYMRHRFSVLLAQVQTRSLPHRQMENGMLFVLSRVSRMMG